MALVLDYKTAVIALYTTLSALGFYYIRLHIRWNAGGEILQGLCTLPTSPIAPQYRFAYVPEGTAITLCALGEFFIAAMEPKSKAYLVTLECLGALPVPVAVTYFESQRSGRSLWIAFPVLYGILYQVLGGGVVLPIWFLAFLLTIPDASRAKKTVVDQASAEAVLLAVVVGLMAPTTVMFAHPDYRIISAWQPFPIFMSVILAIYKSIRRALLPISSKSSGYWTMQATYFVCATFSVAYHIFTVFHFIGSSNFVKDLQALYIPSFNNIPEATLTTAAAHLLQWDSLLIDVSCLVAGLFALSRIGRSFGATTYAQLAQAAPILGPGAVMAGVWMWREKTLKDIRETVDATVTPAASVPTSDVQKKKKKRS